jgi:hypothetical protein
LFQNVLSTCRGSGLSAAKTGEWIDKSVIPGVFFP